MKRKIATLLAILATVCFWAFGFSACDSESSSVEVSEETHMHTYLELVNADALKSEANCTTPAIYYTSCSCGELGTETFEWGKANGHTYKEEIIFPTKKDDGYTLHSCENCEDFYKDTYMPATGSLGLSYAINTDGITCTVTGLGDCTDTELVIGRYIDGYEVTSIREYAFFECYNLTSITIPNSATSIGRSAFEDCSSLTNIVIPDCISIGYRAFYNTGYYNNENNWENGALYIGKYLIEVKTVITGEYKIKEGTLCIAGHAFFDFRSLTSVIIPNSVTSIRELAFSHCERLTSIIIPDSVTFIGSKAFSQCGSLTSIEVSTNNEYYKSIDGNLYTKGGKSLMQYAIGKTDTSFTIPDSVTSIWSSAFENCSSLMSITIPNSVVSIENYAFSGCTSLTSITIPNTVTSIEDRVFAGCSSLTSITIPDSVISIGDVAFGYCTSLTNVEIPSSVTSIGYGAFSECYSLTSIEIPNSVTFVGAQAFYYCSSLASIKISDSVTSINDGMFSYCSSLTDIEIPNSVTSIGFGVFSYCSNVTNIKMSDSLTSIGVQAFSHCSSLTNIEIPNSVTAIKDFMFSYCSSLTNIEIPNSVTSIDDSAFV